MCGVEGGGGGGYAIVDLQYVSGVGGDMMSKCVLQ